VQDEYLVRDALHDLFVRLWTKRAKLGDVDNVRYYLLGGLRNALLDKKRHDQRYQHVTLDDESAFQLSFSPEAEALQHEQQREQLAQLLAAMEQLSPRQKQVIYLRYYQGLEYAQIAELLAINVKGVYKLTARALDALKEIMDVPRPLLLALLLAWRHG
jgi:RNA polymerase sigma factor (sigma-70 family)